MSQLRKSSSAARHLPYVKSQDAGNRSCSPLKGITLEWRRDDEGAEQARRMAWRFKVLEPACEQSLACRRYLMPYIDIGMDVHGEKCPVVGGQVILS